MFRRNCFMDQAEPVPVPRPPAASPGPLAFVLCPVIVPPGVPAGFLLAQQCLYQIALEEALAVARPSLPERDLLASWN